MLMKRPCPTRSRQRENQKAYLWAYRSNDLEEGPRIIVFDYRGGRSGEHARQFLGNCMGT